MKNWEFMQLSIDFSESERIKLISDKTFGLISALNDGLNPKESYLVEKIMQQGIYLVLMVKNKANDMLFNIIDNSGNQPKDISVCWRNAHHAYNDLKELSLS